jgi:nucleoside-diphosphate-sugar epimerase
MRRRIFLAGATGVVGIRLTPLLVDAGFVVFGTTRSASKTGHLKSMGVEPLVLDVFDAAALRRQMIAVRPEIVIHQLTDLAGVLDLALMNDALIRNARIRDEGTKNLVAAAAAAGVRRILSQSIVWAYAPGKEPHVEEDPLDLAADGIRGVSVAGVAALEKSTVGTSGINGIILRYGQFYGPGTGKDFPAGSAPLHVDAAAMAAMLALEKGNSGIYNVAEPNAYASTEKARQELGWDSAFRL